MRLPASPRKTPLPNTEIAANSESAFSPSMARSDCISQNAQKNIKKSAFLGFFANRQEKEEKPEIRNPNPRINDECRMTNAQNEEIEPCVSSFGHSSFVIDSDIGFRNSSFPGLCPISNYPLAASDLST
jgi:hypothetical protein